MLVGALAGNFGHGNRTEAKDLLPFAGINRSRILCTLKPAKPVVLIRSLLKRMFRQVLDWPNERKTTMGCSKGSSKGSKPAKSGGGKKR